MKLTGNIGNVGNMQEIILWIPRDGYWIVGYRVMIQIREFVRPRVGGGMHSTECCLVIIRACERSVSGAENGAERAKTRVERSGAERSVSGETAERERSGERTKSAAPATAPADILLFSLSSRDTN